jgi:peptidoglycan/xylan/chitin deacetylase (PgdA/CDA1 family)
MPFLIREIFSRNKVTVILYHNPKREVFARHVEYLSKRYNFISLETLVNAIYEQDWTEIPPKAIVVTFDDGYEGNYSLLDVFKEYDVCPTIYLCTGIVNTNRKFWFEAGIDDTERVKMLPNNERLQLLKRRIAFEPRREYASKQALNLEEIKLMSPHVDFQSHSKFHPVLTTCTNKECREEIEGSKSQMERLLGPGTAHFSYPNADYSERELEYVKTAGYKSARTLDHGWCDRKSDPYKLKAMYVDDDASINTLCAKCSGIIGYVKCLFHGNLRGRHPQIVRRQGGTNDANSDG